MLGLTLKWLIVLVLFDSCFNCLMEVPPHFLFMKLLTSSLLLKCILSCITQLGIKIYSNSYIRIWIKLKTSLSEGSHINLLIRSKLWPPWVKKVTRQCLPGVCLEYTSCGWLHGCSWYSLSLVVTQVNMHLTTKLIDDSGCHYYSVVFGGAR